MTKLIRQTVTFKATPHEIYEMLMDSRKHAKFSQSTTSMSRKVGAKFSAYDGYITGINLEIEPDKKIVQAWHASDWPEGYMSRVVFRLEPVKGGTRLIFTHRNVPDDQYEDLKQGWIDNYWDPMKEQLKSKSQRKP